MKRSSVKNLKTKQPFKYIVAAKGEWNKELFDVFSKKLEGQWYFCDTPNELNKLLTTVKPRYIFFIHWSWIVSEQIINTYECICFHMTDLPYGRGGSPLQNLIIRGHKNSILSSIRMKKGIDTGPIYYKKKFSLNGSAYKIYKRVSKLSWDMIGEFVKNNPKPKLQKGKIINFTRRTPQQSLLPVGLNLEQIYDYIRMLDAPGYPKAFLETGKYRIEFKDAKKLNNSLNAKVNFFIKED